jgi:hypothetical protein
MNATEQMKAVALVEAGQADGIRHAKKLMTPPPVKPNFKPQVAADRQEI